MPHIFLRLNTSKSVKLRVKEKPLITDSSKSGNGDKIQRKVLQY